MIHVIILTAAIGIGIVLYSLAVIGLAEIVGRIADR